MTTDCRLSRWTETYLDGELSPEHTLDYEDHLSGCCFCQGKLKFEQALRFSMRRTTRIATHPSQGFEAKLRARMAAEREQQSRDRASTGDPHTVAGAVAQHPTQVAPLPHRPLTWRTIAPLSVAAAAALVFAALRNESPDSMTALAAVRANGASVGAKDTVQTVQEFLDQLAADTEHNHDAASAPVEEVEPVVFASARPPSIINLSHDRRWRTPEDLERLGAIWEGIRYRTLASHDRVPSIQYRVGGHRVLLWAYDSQRVPLRVALEPRVALNHPVFVGSRHGLAIAAVERNGHGFAATTDLSQSEAAELVVTAATH